MAKAKAEKVNVEVYLEDVRLSHPHLFEPQQYKKDPNSKPRYTAVFILDKKKHKKLIEEIEDAIEEIREKMFDGRKLKADNICLSDGDDTDRDEYQGCMILRAAASEEYPPELIDRAKNPVSKKDRKLYGGCFVNAIVRLFGYDKYADQVNCGLEAVQHFRKGESFGKAAVDVDKKFKDYDDEEDETPVRSIKRGKRDDDEDEKPARRRPARDDDEDEKPARRRASRDEDEDERPARRRASRDDDEDEKPARRRASRDDDEDEDERPRRRSSRDDD